MIKTKIFPPWKCIFFPNLKTWLRAWFCRKCVCNYGFCFEDYSACNM